MGKRKVQHEELLQREMARFLRLALPLDSEGLPKAGFIPWTAVESSGRGGRDGARQKAKGVNKYWADFQFALASGKVLFVEVKTDNDALRGTRKTYPNKNQKKHHTLLRDSGFYVAVVRSVQELQDCLIDHGVTLKVRAI